jgi:hypothetical protein
VTIFWYCGLRQLLNRFDLLFAKRGHCSSANPPNSYGYSTDYSHVHLITLINSIIFNFNRKLKIIFKWTTWVELNGQVNFLWWLLLYLCYEDSRWFIVIDSSLMVLIHTHQSSSRFADKEWTLILWPCVLKFVPIWLTVLT